MSTVVHGPQARRAGAPYAWRVELRQLRSFVAVAQELHFGRAAKRLHLSGPALSQQVIALERELGVPLFTRDRRSVALTAAGRSLLEDAEQLLTLADSAADRARRALGEAARLRIGYVSWLPDNVEALAAPAASLQVDSWVLPSHAQADRVGDGSLDLAMAWVTAAGAAERGLAAHLLCAEELHAVVPGTTTPEPLPAAELTVLVDADEAAWSSWNVFAEEFAATAGARVVRVTDGGVAGPAFYAHVSRIGRPVLINPKRLSGSPPPGFARRPIADPAPLWTWSLLHRADDDRPAVHAAVGSLLAAARGHGWTSPPAGTWWVPADDPYRELLSGAPGRHSAEQRQNAGP
jgi:DNA-binding transcriptional LysR family regulator